jgi:hypothetical protein
LRTCAGSGGWVLEMSSLRIVVKIPTGTYPELLADLGTVATRARAERLRVLAMVGLRDLRQGSSRGQAVSNSQDPTEEGATDRKASANTIIRKLSSGAVIPRKIKAFCGDERLREGLDAAVGA